MTKPDGTCQICVRPATTSDRPAIQAIFELSVSEALWLPAAAKQNAVFANVSQGEVIHVAEIEAGVIAGLVSVQTADPFIHHLYVHPAARGRSVGQALLNSLRAWLPQPWRLKCVRQNVGALQFYRRCGWEEAGSGQSEHGDFLILSFRQSPARGIAPFLEEPP